MSDYKEPPLLAGHGIMRSAKKLGEKSPDLRGKLVIPEGIEPGMTVGLVAWYNETNWSGQKLLTVRIRMHRDNDKWPKEVQGDSDVPL